MAENKLFIRDLSDLQIQHVNSKMITFRQDLRIRGLRSTIGATVQKVKFWSTLEPLSFFVLHSPPPKNNSSSNLAASTTEPKEDW
jgi:hypothetical protein